MQAQGPVDVITWRIIASTLCTLCVALAIIVGKSYLTRLQRLEDKINGIIKYLITTAKNGEREALSKLIGE